MKLAPVSPQVIQLYYFEQYSLERPAAKGVSAVIKLNPDSPEPLFRQLYQQILDAIARGDIANGEALRPVRKVAVDFGINPGTVQKAYDLLHDDGVITTSDRSGSVVTVPAQASEETLTRATADLSSVLSRARAQGATPAQLTNLATRIINEMATS